MILIDKIGDNNSRIRESSENVFVEMAKCNGIGCN